MTSKTINPASNRWRTIAFVLALALAATLGSAITVAAQNGERDHGSEQATTTSRDTERDATVDDLSAGEIAELGGEEAAEAALSTSAAIDGTFNSGRGTYVARSSQCVLFDTRGGPKLSPGSTTTFSLTGGDNVGGETGCNVPSTALSAHVNLVAIGPNSVGNLKIYGASLATEPDGGIVNFQNLSPNLNNSNAFIVDRDDDGWNVKVNGGGVHVRAVLMGNFFDGGSSFAAASHDHGVVQATGGTLHVDQTTAQTVRTVNMTMQDECGIFLSESHSALVTISGYAFPHAGASNADVELWVDGTEETAARIEFADEDVSGVNQVPLSKTFLVEDLSSGTHTFASRSHLESAGSAAVDIDADIVVEHRGWTCDLIIISGQEE